MAIMHFNVKAVSRARGSSAVSRAAYTAREKLHDERRHRTYDFRERGGLEHAEIMLPTNSPTDSTGWARDRATLWNRAEAAERPKNARVAREYVVALPHELGPGERLELARGLAQSIADRYGTAVDLAVHRATEAGDQRNHHAHILSTTRELTASGLGRKTDIELSDTSRRERGLPRAGEEIRLLRHHWADLVNDKLREARLETRVDARSLWEQGSARVPSPHLRQAIIAIERAGGHSYAAERLREEHAARQQLMLEYARAEARAVTAPARPVGAAHALAPGAGDAAIDGRQPAPASLEASRPLGISERQQLAAERWLAYRRALEQGREPRPRLGRERSRDHGAELEL
jgi:hypothetical protein